MNISKIEKDQLNAQLKVEITESDYATAVENTMKQYRKTANIPGFRKGHAPMGMIRKMYGKSVLVDEVNKVLQNAVYEYLTKNDLNILGNPIPANESDINWEDKNFEFLFDMGLSPEFEVKLNKKMKFDFYKIVADDKMVDGYVNDIASRYGKMTSPDESAEGDTLFGEFVELDDKGEVRENGITNNSNLPVDKISDGRIRKKFVGVKKGDELVFNPTKALGSAKEVAELLGVDEKIAESLSSDFKMTVKNISRMEPAELNTELFDKLYGEGEVKTEEEFRAKITEEAERMFVNESDRKFLNDATEKIMEKVSIELPDEFLKRWLETAGEKPLSKEEIEKEYPNYAMGTKWQLIESKIAEENEVQITREEIETYTRDRVKAQLAQYGQMDMEDSEIDGIVQNVLNNQDEMRRVSDEIFGQKLLDLLKEKCAVKTKEVTYDEFVKLATK